jgi:hypothetical protein
LHERGRSAAEAIGTLDIVHGRLVSLVYGVLIDSDPAELAVGASLFRMRRPATAAPRRYQG